METPSKKLSADAKRALREQAEKIVHENEEDSLKSLGALSPDVARQMLHELHVYQIELEMQNEELLKAEVALESQRRHYFDLYDLAPVGYCTLSEEGLIVQANLTAAELLGLTRSRLVKQPISNFILKEDQDIYYLWQKHFFDLNMEDSCELRVLNHNGSILWVHLSARTASDCNDIPEVHLTITDISKHKRLEDRLRLKEEMVFSQSRQAAMGEMMSMIAHQWRQPLNNLALLNQDNYVKMKLGRLDEKSFDISHDMIDKNLQFMSKTIDDFRNFFRPDQIKEKTTLDEVIKSALAMIGTSLKNNTIEISLQSTSTKALLIHKNSLIHVLLNILSNAKDAFEINNIAQATVMISIDETPEMLHVSVCDNAGGIPEAILDQLAQPYFTTKGVSGTGLGLYISRTIIEKYFSGTLEWRNNAANGACFVISLDIKHVNA
ncbi:MAG TPA: ATP-binding protein [Sulfuricurvum sp.]|nr:ATP-binding protein [Sulfuricurvum sp.]